MFKENGTVIFNQGSTISFIMDESKSPVWLDFTIKRRDMSMVIPALIEFINENTIRIEQFTPGGEHSTQFSSKGEFSFRNQHVLKRQ